MTGKSAHATALRTPPIRTALVGLLLATALGSLDQNIVSAALPQITAELGGLLQISWVVTAFIVGSASTTLLYAKLSDMYGRRRLFVASITIFLIGSAMCGFAHSTAQLIMFRCVQGLGDGGLVPLAQAALGDLVEPRERSRYQGMFIGVFTLCSVVGPVLGGIITALLSWRWIFYINIPLGAIALAFVIAGLRRQTQPKNHNIDYVGAVLTATAAGTLLLVFAGLQGAMNRSMLGGLGLAEIVLLISLSLWERNAKEPILPAKLFKERAFAVTIMVSTLNAMALVTAIVYLPTYYQLVFGMSPWLAGMMIVPLMIGVIIGSLFAGRAVARTGKYKVFPVIGLATAAVAFGGLAWHIADGGNIAVIEVCLTVVGAAIGLVMPNLTIAIQNSVDRKDLGAASGTAIFFRLLGSAIGVAASGIIVALELPAADSVVTAHFASVTVDATSFHEAGAIAHVYSHATVAAFRQAITLAFGFGSIVAALAFFVSLLMPERPLRSGDPSIVSAQQTRA